MKARAISGFDVPAGSVSGALGYALAATESIPDFYHSCSQLCESSGKSGVMRMFERLGRIVLGALMVLAISAPAMALDDKIVVQQPERSPWAVFKFGFSAYKNGKKEEAVEAYRYAAENGQVGARWKLARMYADGDGVTRNDYEAFRFFSAVAQLDVQPGSVDETYVADALVAVARYLKNGIPGT